MQIVYRTGNADALANGGKDAQFAFKTGGALDLMLGTDANADAARADPVAGDERLLVTRQDGKMVAMLYRAVVPGTPDLARTAFTSPVGRATFDRVDDVSDEVKLTQNGGDFTLVVPLQTLGLDPTKGAVRADFGLLRGDGAQTTRRLYWSNKNTDIVSDIPSEARLQPNQWGALEFGP